MCTWVKKGNIILYINTNRYIKTLFYKKSYQLYDCDIELLKASLDDYTVIKRYRGIKFSSLISIIKRLYQ